MKYLPIEWSEFKPKKLEFVSKRKKDDNGWYKTESATEFSALDTETSKVLLDEERNDYIGWIYQWCFSYPAEEEGVQLLVYGRRPSELVESLKKIIEVNGLHEGTESDRSSKIMYFVVHNLSYDYTYIKDWLEQTFGHKCKVLATDPHKLISFEIGGLVFKCSYKLSLRSLENWGAVLGVENQKLVGEIDYDTVRYQDTDLGGLDSPDWRYMFGDVKALYECYSEEMKINGDDLTTVPLTSTAYLRRFELGLFNEDEKNRKKFKEERMDSKTYKLIMAESAGGLTLGNRHWAGATVRVDEIVSGEAFIDWTDTDFSNVTGIRHRDFVSHYPSQQKTTTCPVGKFVQHYNRFSAEKSGAKKWTFDDLEELDKKREFLAVVEVTKATLHSEVTAPYLQVHKCVEGSAKSKRGYIKTSVDFDRLVHFNGRVIELDGKCYIVINKYDYKILKKQYDMEWELVLVYSAPRGPFPEYIQRTVDHFFKSKTERKAEVKRLEKEGYAKNSPEMIFAKKYLEVDKARLNSCFGCSDTSPVRLENYEDEAGEWHKSKLTEEYLVDKLDRYYEAYSSFNELRYGTWTSAAARYELIEFIELIGYEYFLYADTDSIFYLSTPEIEAKIEARNRELRELGDKNGWYVEVNGKKVYYNQFEDEDEDIREFRFLHAKCYAYNEKVEGKEGYKLSCTIAGVPAYTDDKTVTREEELGGIDNLKHGKTFTLCGGTQCKYVNHRPTIEEVDGHMTEYASAAIITKATKTLKAIIEDPFVWAKED